MKSARGRGGLVEGILYENVAVVGPVQTAIDVDLEYEGSDVPPTNRSATPVFRNVTLHNVTGRSTNQSIFVRGLPESPIEAFSMHGVSLTSDSSAAITTTHAEVLMNHVAVRPLP